MIAASGRVALGMYLGFAVGPLAFGAIVDGTSSYLAGWSVLYFALGYWYWPAALLGPCLFTAAWWQARPAVDTFAHLTEAVFDLHAADLARAVGLEPSAGQFSPSLGLEVTAVLRKQA